MPLRTRSKYRNKRCVVNGIKFQSIKEGTRYIELLQLLKEGKIQHLKLQVPFSLFVNGLLICKYKADFVYYDSSGKRIVEDTKGFKTDIYKLKKKLLKAIYGITILET